MSVKGQHSYFRKDFKMLIAASRTSTYFKKDFQMLLALKEDEI